MTGKIEKIYVTPNQGSRLLPVASVELEFNKGVRGDRYHADKLKSDDKIHKANQELTLIEAEEIEKFNLDHGINIGFGEFRRNVVTRGIRLNTLIGKVFTINGLKVEGIAACPPCNRLAEIVHPAIITDMQDCAGLRAAVLASGQIKVGDSIDE